MEHGEICAERADAPETPEIRLRGDIASRRATAEAIRALLEKPGNLG